ncbi:MAG: efflux RND transporter periplasmic adaptor subunit [Halioglobus sp.]
MSQRVFGLKSFSRIGFFVASITSLTVFPATAEQLPPLDCAINPYRTIDLASSVPGVLARVDVALSDFVTAGQVVASLEAGVESASVALADARAGIESEIKVSEVNLDYDRRRKNRMDSLYEKKTVSIEIRDEASRDHSLSRWRLQQAKDLKQIRQLELVRAQEQLKQKIIRSPIDGFVLKTFKDAGEYVEDQPVVRIAQLNPLSVDALVPIDLHGRITQGMNAKVYTQESAQSPLLAQVTVIEKVGDAASGTYSVRLSLPNPDFKILAGVKCSIQFGSGAVSAAGGSG